MRQILPLSEPRPAPVSMLNSDNRGGGMNADGICMSGNDATIKAQDNELNTMKKSAR
jgi:hypothetical protein